MKKTPKLKLSAALLLAGSLLLTTSVSAFSDVQGDDAGITESLQQKGIIQGITPDKFVPMGKLTGAQAVTMIVNGLGLKVKDAAKSQVPAKDEWYSSALRIAADKGIKLPKDFDPNAELTREAFADILVQAVGTTGDYPMVKMFIEIADADQITVEYSGHIQQLLLMKIASLDEQGKFHPQDTITRIEAARLVYNAAEYIDKYEEAEQGMQDNVSFQVEKVNDQINKVVLTRAEQPNPGYGIRVAKVEFSGDKATVYYELLSPEPGMNYIQVISDTRAETYISSQYTVEVKKLP